MKETFECQLVRRMRRLLTKVAMLRNVDSLTVSSLNEWQPNLLKTGIKFCGAHHMLSFFICFDVQKLFLVPWNHWIKLSIETSKCSVPKSYPITFRYHFSEVQIVESA